MAGFDYLSGESSEDVKLAEGQTEPAAAAPAFGYLDGAEKPLSQKARTPAPAPDAAAKAYKQADAFGVTPALALDAPEDMARVEQQKRAAEFADKAPVAAAHLDANQRAYDQAHDDFDALQVIADVYGGFRSLRDATGNVIANTVARASSDLLFGTGAAVAGAVATNDAFDVAMGEGPSWLERGAAQIEQMLLKQQAEFGDEAQANIEAATEGRPDEVKFALEGVGSAGQMLTFLLAAGRRNALGAMTGTAGASSYGEGRSQGLSAEDSFAFAARDMASEYITEKIPFDHLFKSVLRGDSFAATIGKQMLGEGFGEQFATFSQDANAWLSLPENKDKTLSEFLDERPEAAYRTLISTMAAVGVQTSLVYGANSIARRLGEQAEAERDANFIETLTRASENSLLRERDPQAFAQLVDVLAQDAGAPLTMFADTDHLRFLAEEYPEEFRALVDKVPSLAESLTSSLAGGVVEFKTSELMAALPGSTLEKALTANLRTAPDKMTLAESKRAAAKAEEELGGIVNDVLQQQNTTQKFRDSSARVLKGFTDSLVSTGRMSPANAAAAARLPHAWYTVQAQRLGMLPEEVMAQYPLSVIGQSERDARLAARGAQDVVEQPRLRFDLSETGLGARMARNAATGAGVLYRVDGGRVILESLKTDVAARGKGHAQAVLRELLAAADAAGLPVELEALGIGRGMDTARLVRGYERAGFVIVPGATPENVGGVPMRREAQQPQESSDALEQARGGDVAAGTAGDDAGARSRRAPGGVHGAEGTLAQDLRWPALAADARLAGSPADTVLRTGERYEVNPSPKLRVTAAGYMESAGLVYQPATIFAPIVPERSKRIAQAFEDMAHFNLKNPDVRAAYEALSRETLAQFNYIREKHPEMVFEPMPRDANGNRVDAYDETGPWGAIKDLVENNHMFYFPTDGGFGTKDSTVTPEDMAQHPMLQKTGIVINGEELVVNDVFRIVHDVFGHAKDGVGFRARGEENAWQSHASMFSPLARHAAATELRGQNSWLNFGPYGESNAKADTANTVFADQKVDLLPQWVVDEGAAYGPLSGTPISAQQAQPQQDTRDPEAFYQNGPEDGWYYSPVIKFLETVTSEKMTAEEWAKKLKPGTVVGKAASLSATEIAWHRLVDFTTVQKTAVGEVQDVDEQGNPKTKPLLQKKMGADGKPVMEGEGKNKRPVWEPVLDEQGNPKTVPVMVKSPTPQPVFDSKGQPVMESVALPGALLRDIAEAFDMKAFTGEEILRRVKRLNNLKFSTVVKSGGMSEDELNDRAQDIMDRLRSDAEDEARDAHERDIRYNIGNRVSIEEEDTDVETDEVDADGEPVTEVLTEYVVYDDGDEVGRFDNVREARAFANEHVDSVVESYMEDHDGDFLSDYDVERLWDQAREEAEQEGGGAGVMHNDSGRRAEGGDDESYRELLVVWDGKPAGRDFYQPDHGAVHFKELNYVGHIRFDVRLAVVTSDTQVEKLEYMFIDELQNDWGQIGRAKGYETEDTTAEEQALQARAAEANAAFAEATKARSAAMYAYRETSGYKELQKRIDEAEAKRNFYESKKNALRAEASLAARAAADASAAPAITDGERAAIRQALSARIARDEKVWGKLQERQAKARALWETLMQRSEIEEGLALAKEVAAYDAARSAQRDAAQAYSTFKQKKGRRLPDMPFKESAEGALLMIKRAIAYAVENGHDRIAITPGYVQDIRWGLARHFDKLVIENNGDETDLKYRIQPYDTTGRRADRTTEWFDESEFEKFVNVKNAKVIREKIANGDDVIELDNEALNTGDKALSPFYDGVIPKELRKFLKNFNIELETASFASDDGKYPSWIAGKTHKKIYAEYADGTRYPVSFVDTTSGQEARFIPASNLLDKLGSRGWFSLGSVRPQIVEQGVGSPHANERPVSVVVEVLKNEDDGPEAFALESSQEVFTFKHPVPADWSYLGVEEGKQRVGIDEEEAQNLFLQAVHKLASRVNAAMSKVIEAPAFTINDELRDTVKAGLPLFQKPGSEPLGEFNPYERTIALLNTSNLSTFLHEAGHAFLEMQMDMATAQGVPQQIRDDAQTLLDELGFTGTPDDWLRTPVSLKRKQHEKFANMFEHYLFKGDAPSVALRGVFETFSQWLKDVYKSLVEFLRQFPAAGEINPTVTAVMDRMLATDEEIEEAQNVRNMTSMFATAEEAGMNETDFREHQKSQARARAEAEADVNARKMRDMQYVRNAHGREVDRLKRRAADLRKDMRARVSEEVANDPVYAALLFLRRGTVPTANFAYDGPAFKLSADELNELLPAGSGVDFTHLTRGGKYAITGRGDNVVSVHAAAQAFGFPSGEAFISALANARPYREVVEALTDERMLAEHGEIASDAAIAKAADRAVHSASYARFLATQQAALDALVKAGTGGAAVLTRAAKAFAEKTITRSKIRDLKPLRYTSAETRLGKEAREAFKKNDLKTAAAKNRAQLAQHHLAAAAYEAEEEVDGIIKYLRKFSKASVRSKMGGDDLLQLDALLARFDLRVSVSLKQIDAGKEALKDFAMRRATELGVVEPDIEAWLENEGYRKNYKELTVGELRGLRDAVKQLEMLARRERQMYKAIKNQTFQEERDAILAKMREAHPDAFDADGAPKKVDLMQVGPFKRKVKSFASDFIGDKVGLETFAELLGGGPIQASLFGRISEASSVKSKMLGDAYLKLQPFFDAYSIVERSAFGMKDIGTKAIGIPMTRERAVVTTLLWGSESGRQRLENYGWGEPQVKAIMGLLDERDLKLVNAIWSTFDDMVWPEMKALNERTRGVAPGKIEALGFEVKGVPMRGGYYPLKAEPATDDSSRHEIYSAEESLANIRNGMGASAKTRDSASKQRNETANYQPKLSLEVMSQVMNETIHDIAFREAVVDTHRLLRDPSIRAVIINTYGFEAYQGMTRNLGDVAASPVNPMGWQERIVSAAKKNTLVTLLSGVKTALVNVTGIVPAMSRVNPALLLKYTARFNLSGWLSGDYKSCVDASDYMKGRFESYDRDLKEKAKQFSVNGSIMPDTAVFLGLMGLTDRMVAVPVWHAAYEQKINELVKASGDPKKGHDEAVAYADMIVRQTQGSGREVDLPQLSRGNNVYKQVFTMFHSYFNGQLQQLILAGAVSAREARENRPLAVAKFTGKFMALWALPAIVTVVITDALSAAGGSADDEDKEEWYRKYLRATALYGFAFFPIARVVGPFAYAQVDPDPSKPAMFNNDLQLSPIASYPTSISKGAYALDDLLSGEGDNKDIRAAIFGVSMLVGAPGKLISDVTLGTKAWLEDAAPPTAIVLGPPKGY